MIKSISISNYKSFGDVSLELSPFSVFIGPNAAGKTNLIDAFRFIQESVDGDHIFNVARRRLGWHGIRCQKKNEQIVSFALTGVYSGDFKISFKELENAFAPPSFQYSFSFRHEELIDEYIVTDEQAEIRSRLLDSTPDAEQGKLSSFKREESTVLVYEYFEPEWEKRQIPVSDLNRGYLFIASRFDSLASPVVSDEIMHWRFYDPDPQAARSPSRMTKPVFMSETGDTLALVLDELSKEDNGEDYSNRARLRDIMQTMVPGFEDWETELAPNGEIIFRVKESHLQDTLHPVMVSDGTVRLLVILAALLYPQRTSVVFIEEPERNLHPLVMEQLVDLMRVISEEVQIIVTTHSADFVRYCRPEEVFLMDKVEGLTKARRADSIEQIDKFLQLFALDELWLQGDLEVGIPL